MVAARRYALIIPALNGAVSIAAERCRKILRAAMLLALALSLVVFFVSAPSYASGHGPLFGLSEPVLGQGAVELDEFFGVRGGSPFDGTMFTSMISYGITGNLQLSVTAPYLIHQPPMLSNRLNAMMPGNNEAEGLLAWRFQRKEWGIGKRYGSTAYFGLDLPTAADAMGVRGGPGFYEAVATGYASRSWYAWSGIGDNQFTSRLGDMRPNDLFYSGVLGYRPKFLRGNWTKPDGRLFIEMIGDHLGSAERSGLNLPQTRGDQIMLGPTTLWLFRNFGIEGGIVWPVYQDFEPGVPRERYRIAIDITYFFPLKSIFGRF